MSQWITQRGESMIPVGQDSLMECWITCYKMILQANGLNWDLNKIENILVAGGFNDAPKCRTTGFGDEDLVKAAKALKMGYNRTSAIASLSGLRMMLQMCGPLWVAGIFPMQQKPHTTTFFKHMVTLIGVDEERNQVCYVNPWKQSLYDIPSKLWIDWNYIKESIKNTINVEASLQYLTPIQTVALSMSANA